MPHALLHCSFRVLRCRLRNLAAGTFAGHPDPRTAYNAFYLLFARNETAGLSVLGIFSLVAALFFRRRAEAGPEAPSRRNHRRGFILALGIAALVFVIAVLGTRFVSHNYALSADEFMADFQARIFLRGEITAAVPAHWIPALRVIKPTYVDYFPDLHAWKSAYLPGYAALRAAFQIIHLQALLNPFLAALTILALFGTARAIWPDEKQNAVVAILLLAGSAQFLVMAMTSYSMPAHLALNTIWLWLYSSPERRRFYLAPFVGVFAIGLHQPIVHALFAAPFLGRLVWERKWRVVCIFGLIYSLGCAGWLCWRIHFTPPAAQSTASFFGLWNPKMFIVQPMNLLLLLGWSTLATPLLAVLGACQLERQPAIVRDAASSCLITFAFYYFFRPDQGHGWGYRYFHGSISCLILVAVAGWHSLIEEIGARPACQYLSAALAISLAVALPLRCWQVETFIRPFAQSSEMIHSAKAEVVAVNLLDCWYAADLIRNDPYLEDRPIVAAVVPNWLTVPEVKTLSQSGPARFFNAQEFARLGMGTVRGENYRSDPFWLGRRPAN